ncbi:MAG TPA: hypothetical protein PLH65_01795 [bacterium]|nr:hypothetical protein [bacterium]
MPKLIVRNSRHLIAFLIFIGLLFLTVGLGLLVSQISGWWQVDSDKKWIFGIFEFFALFIGGTIAVSQIINFINPFVMLKIDEKGLSFGTGWRYTPYLVPWEAIESATVVPNANFSILQIVKDTSSVQIIVKSGGQIPASLTTSAGIMYVGNNLTLSGDYIDCPAGLIVETVNEKINN